MTELVTESDEALFTAISHDYKLGAVVCFASCAHVIAYYVIS